MSNKEEKIITNEEEKITKLKKPHKNSVAKRLTDWNHENKKIMLDVAQEEQEQQAKQKLEQLTKKELEEQPKHEVKETMPEKNGMSSYIYAARDVLAIVGIAGIGIYYFTTKTKQPKPEIKPLDEKKTSESKIEKFRMQ